MSECDKSNSCQHFKDEQYVSLKEYVESKFEMSEKAVDLAFTSLDKRLESMNEFRSALKDQQIEFIRRPEHELIASDVKSLQLSRAEISGKANQNDVTVSTGIAITGVCLSILNLIIFWMSRGGGVVK